MAVVKTVVVSSRNAIEKIREDTVVLCDVKELAVKKLFNQQIEELKLENKQRQEATEAIMKAIQESIEQQGKTTQAAVESVSQKVEENSNRMERIEKEAETNRTTMETMNKNREASDKLMDEMMKRFSETRKECEQSMEEARRTATEMRQRALSLERKKQPLGAGEESDQKKHKKDAKNAEKENNDMNTA